VENIQDGSLGMQTPGVENWLLGHGMSTYWWEKNLSRYVRWCGTN